LRRRRILRLKKEVVTGGRRQLHTEEISYRYSLPDIVTMIKLRRIIRAEHVVHVEETKNICKILARKQEGKRRLERHFQRWDDNIKMDV
jgi:hypothetical protein